MLIALAFLIGLPAAMAVVIVTHNFPLVAAHGVFDDTRYPSSVTNACANVGPDSGDWNTPQNAEANDNVVATIAPGLLLLNNIFCNRWATFSFSVPAGTTTFLAVVAEFRYSMAPGLLGDGDLKVGVQTSNGPTNCAVQTHTGGTATLTDFSLNFTACKAWAIADFNGNAVSFECGGHRTAILLSPGFSLDYVRLHLRYVV